MTITKTFIQVSFVGYKTTKFFENERYFHIMLSKWMPDEDTHLDLMKRFREQSVIYITDGYFVFSGKVTSCQCSIENEKAFISLSATDCKKYESCEKLLEECSRFHMDDELKIFGSDGEKLLTTLPVTFRKCRDYDSAMVW